MIRPWGYVSLFNNLNSPVFRTRDFNLANINLFWLLIRNVSYLFICNSTLLNYFMGIRKIEPVHEVRTKFIENLIASQSTAFWRFTRFFDHSNLVTLKTFY